MNSLLHTMLSAIDLFNIAMSFGIVFLVLAIRQAGKENKVLHERNLREQSRQGHLFR